MLGTTQASQHVGNELRLCRRRGAKVDSVASLGIDNINRQHHDDCTTTTSCLLVVYWVYRYRQPCSSHRFSKWGTWKRRKSSTMCGSRVTKYTAWRCVDIEKEDMFHMPHLRTYLYLKIENTCLSMNGNELRLCRLRGVFRNRQHHDDFTISCLLVVYWVYRYRQPCSNDRFSKWGTWKRRKSSTISGLRVRIFYLPHFLRTNLQRSINYFCSLAAPSQWPRMPALGK